MQSHSKMGQHFPCPILEFILEFQNGMSHLGILKWACPILELQFDLFLELSSLGQLFPVGLQYQVGSWERRAGGRRVGEDSDGD